MSSKSVNQSNLKGGEMRRQRSEMLIDRTAHSLASRANSSNQIFCAMQNRIEVPKVVRATPAPFHNQLAHSPQSTEPAKAAGLSDSVTYDNSRATFDTLQLKQHQQASNFLGQKKLPTMTQAHTSGSGMSAEVSRYRNRKESMRQSN